MTFKEFLMEQSLIEPNEFDRKGKKMKYPNVYKNKGAGSSQRVSAQTVEIKDSKTGKVYGRRTLYQKDSEGREE